MKSIHIIILAIISLILLQSCVPNRTKASPQSEMAIRYAKLIGIKNSVAYCTKPDSRISLCFVIGDFEDKLGNKNTVSMELNCSPSYCQLIKSTKYSGQR